MWKILEMQVTWVRHAEAKALRILTISLAFTAALTAAVNVLPSSGLSVSVLLGGAICSQVVTAWLSCRVLMPQTRHGSIVRPTLDLIYFGDIASFKDAADADRYAELLVEVMADSRVFAPVIARQIRAVALVASHKIRGTRHALMALRIAVVLTASGALAWLIIERELIDSLAQEFHGSD